MHPFSLVAIANQSARGQKYGRGASYLMMTLVFIEDLAGIQLKYGATCERVTTCSL